MKRYLAAALLILGSGYDLVALADNHPWAERASCKTESPKPEGLHPDARAALASLALSHRITQGLNVKVEPGNVHTADGMIGNQPYTGAVDISTRCLEEEQIKLLLVTLAEKGFVAWYRKPCADGWGKGASHVHAVWTNSVLKPVLRGQVESWLQGKNGLKSNAEYKFWQPSAELKKSIRARFQAAHSFK